MKIEKVKIFFDYVRVLGLVFFLKCCGCFLWFFRFLVEFVCLEEILSIV